jgi:hypothetical protein
LSGDLSIKNRKTAKDQQPKNKDDPMEDNTKKTSGSSRREVLTLGAYALGALGAIGIAGGANAQVAAKAKQKAVMYQQTPKDGKQCSGCQHFQAPSSCRIVDGEINPSGYCILFAKKPA